MAQPKKFLGLVCAGAALLAAPAQAASLDPLIEGAKLCTRHLPRYEREYGIPTHLLSAIASTESGRYHKGLGINVPWPWSINVEGKGYVYDSKQQAIAAVKKFKSRGIQSIDVGCMQVNLYHHPNAFTTLDEAFEPEYNIAYAAGFLRNLFQEDGSWKKAAADYHSRTPSLGREYVGQVYDSWYRIISKLRAARLAVPETSVAAMQDMQKASYVSRVSSVTPSPKNVARLPEQRGKKVASYKSPRMNSIRVTKKTTREDSSPLIVTSQQNESKPLTVAQAKPAADALPTPKIIHIDNPIPTPASTHRTGPNFIFND